jgi:hypothetical protein
MPSCRGITLQVLLASHQLFLMTMASHHRRRHPAASHRRRLVTASHRRLLMTASHLHLLVVASHRRLLLAASHRNRVLAASRHKQPPPCAAGLHLARSPPSCCHRLGSSGSDTNCWSCIKQPHLLLALNLSISLSLKKTHHGET